ncbi:hypothetical protein [Mesomycoplasma ovipneumoniae]|nr:hypothetical protein [Mesomycoplasma ovipneumoniae]WNM14602.1 hypothetical protein RNM01_02525 [Mesomycoplasma ovipneumoniae]
MKKKLKLFKFITNIIAFSSLSLSVFGRFDIIKIQKAIQILNLKLVI